jgi:hypothetical protein
MSRALNRFHVISIALDICHPFVRPRRNMAAERRSSEKNQVTSFYTPDKLLRKAKTTIGVGPRSWFQQFFRDGEKEWRDIVMSEGTASNWWCLWREFQIWSGQHEPNCRFTFRHPGLVACYHPFASGSVALRRANVNQVFCSTFLTCVLWLFCFPIFRPVE